jgi:hypothetical protein
MAPSKYVTATSLRTALETRLQQTARKDGSDLQRLRRQVAFDRLLARFFSRTDAPWVLKGGYAMELRLAVARTTKDIDLNFIGNNPSQSSRTPQRRNLAILESLQTYARIDMGDFFVYKIGEPIMDLNAPLYGGARYPVEAGMDNRVFASFHLDVAVGDVLIEPLERIEGKDWLGFAGITKVSLQAISAEQQFAEKLHAYTLPRQTPNSRVRDLVDMLLLLNTGRLSREAVTKALDATFAKRGTHSIPDRLVPPPPDWNPRFAALAAECNLSSDIDEGFASIERFINSLQGADQR